MVARVFPVAGMHDAVRVHFVEELCDLAKLCFYVNSGEHQEVQTQW